MTTTTRWLPGLAITLLLTACGGADGPPAEAAVSDSRGAGASGAQTAPVPATGGDVLGTIQGTIEGREIEWYVISGSMAGQPYASGLWMGETVEERQILAGGFDTPEPPLESFGRSEDGMPNSYGDYDGSVLSIILPEALGPAPFTVRFPSNDVSTASAFFQPQATLDDIMNKTFWLAEGVLEVTGIGIDADVAHMQGTFSGTFRSTGTGEAVVIQDGRFNIRNLPSLASIQP